MSGSTTVLGLRVLFAAGFVIVGGMFIVTGSAP
jgi:hypothetical protein